MKNFKLSLLGYGVVAATIITASGCYMDGQNRAPYGEYPSHRHHASRMDMRHDAHAQKMDQHNPNKSMSKSASKASGNSSKVAQKTSPGPKQTAAPQLPVIQ